MNAVLGVIGGSGLYEIDGLSDIEQADLDTPFGKPSDVIVIGTLSGVRVAFLPRHGRGHRLNPTNIPARANIYALKSLGVERLISISAVGSLQEEYAPLDLVLPDQLIDRTRLRGNTFFDDAVVAHIGFADPFCAASSAAIYAAAQEMGIKAHSGGAMVVMEGPAFSTRAESLMYRSWGAGIIGMTALPEAKLAREAELCYATMAWITDYDCWRQGEETVTVEMIIGNLTRNVAASKELLRRAAPAVSGLPPCACQSALQDAILTRPEAVPPEIKARLQAITGKYFGP